MQRWGRVDRCRVCLHLATDVTTAAPRQQAGGYWATDVRTVGFQRLNHNQCHTPQCAHTQCMLRSHSITLLVCIQSNLHVRQSVHISIYIIMIYPNVDHTTCRYTIMVTFQKVITLINKQTCRSEIQKLVVVLRQYSLW